MRKKLLIVIPVALLAIGYFFYGTSNLEKETNKIEETIVKFPKGKKKTPEERARFAEERALYEYKLQANPETGKIPRAEKELEFKMAQKAELRTYGENLRAPDASFINRGPTNLGGRTRAIVIDRSDNTGNTIIAGGVSSGVFRTTNGGTSWTKVSASDEIHNVTCIVQDPRAGFESTWYYGTGESQGNSAGAGGAFYLGRGIWKSTDGGLSWSQIINTNSTQESFNSRFDTVTALAVHPTTGELFAAINGRVSRFDGLSWISEVTNPGGSISTAFLTDVVITSSGRVYAAFSGSHDTTIEGVWTSSTGNKTTGAWSRINAGSFTPAGRVVLALAPSNQDKLYVLFGNGTTSDCSGLPAPEAELWMWDQSGSTWTDYSAKLPDEAGCSDGNDPFAIQGGYDLVISVKPNDENFVVIGGTNAYKMADITAVGSFSRIGGYLNTSGYSLYNTAGGVEHHPDIHSMVFNPFSNNVLFTGTDGGIHKTNDVTAGTVDWISLNNNYQTQQFYHVAIDPLSGSDIVIGGLQDNGTNFGGTGFGQPDLTTQTRFIGADGVAVGVSRDAACIPLFCGWQNGTIYRNCSGWTLITPALSSSQFVTYFHLDQSNNKNLYYAGRGVLYRTTDATNVTSATWTNLGSPTSPSFLDFGDSGSDQWLTRFSTTWGAYNAATSYLLMGGDVGTVLRLDDPQNATDLSTVVNITPPGVTSGTVTGLAIHPSNRDIVLLTYSNYGLTNIFLTTNATSATPSWTVVERNLSSHSIRSAAITEVSGETMYLVGTARGLYSTTDPTSVDWVREAPSLIGYAVVSSLAYRPADNKLLIGTHGNGMFEATITQVLGVNDVDISDDITVYPNPVGRSLNLKLPSSMNGDINYSIHNILGQEVTKGIVDNNTIDVQTLNSGVYFVQIASEGKKGVKRIIKK